MTMISPTASSPPEFTTSDTYLETSPPPDSTSDNNHTSDTSSINVMPITKLRLSETSTSNNNLRQQQHQTQTPIISFQPTAAKDCKEGMSEDEAETVGRELLQINSPINLFSSNPTIPTENASVFAPTTIHRSCIDNCGDNIEEPSQEEGSIESHFFEGVEKLLEVILN